MPVANVKSVWVGGDLYFYDKAGLEIFHIDGTNRKLVLPSGSALDASAATSILSLAAGEIGAADLSSNLKTGFIPLPLASWRLIVSNDIPVIAVASGGSGILASDTAPKLKRVNAATDKKLKIEWASSSSIEITTDVTYPPDLDDTATVVFHCLAKMAAGGMDTPTISVGYFEGIGDTDAGGATAALSTTLAEKTVTIAAADIGLAPTGASIALTPGAHTNEALELYATWLTYTRKS